MGICPSHFQGTAWPLLIGILIMRFQLTAATSPTCIQTQGTQVEDGEEATR